MLPTPIMLAMAARVGLPLLPPAMTTALPANTAGLLLPVGNLTNLLAVLAVVAATAALALTG